MDPRQPFDRPNTLGQSWRRMKRSRPRNMDNLPPLPDWPPLPEDGLRVGWSSARADSATPGEPNATDAGQQTTGAAAAQSPRQRWSLRYGRGVLDRWRRTTTRMKLGIGGVIVISLLLIGSCCSLSLYALGALGGGGSTPGLGASATQQTTGLGGTSGKSSTATATPKGTATATRTATRTATPPLTITFTCASGSLRGTGKVCVHTAPSAVLSLSVRYCDGTTAKGLHSAGIANASGDYTWSWSVHMTCVGPATATVTAKYNGVTLTAKKTFNITA